MDQEQLKEHAEWVSLSYATVICEIKLFWNNFFEIISVFYFTCNRVWNRNKITSDTEGVLKLFQNYFSNNKRVGKST